MTFVTISGISVNRILIGSGKTPSDPGDHPVSFLLPMFTSFVAAEGILTGGA